MEELLAKLKKSSASFFDDATKAAAGNKAAGARSRKASMEIRQLLKEWRKASTAE